MEDRESGLPHIKEEAASEEDLRNSLSEDPNASLLGIESCSQRTSRRAYAQSIPSLRAHIWITAANVILFTTSLAFMVITLSSDTVTTLQDHWRATSFYSPMYDRLKIDKVVRKTNGTLFDTTPPSIWRQRKGPEADAAWNRVGSYLPPIVISSKEVEALGKDPKNTVRMPESYGYGPDAYLASVESFHHIHCLDKLRREIAYKHYWEKEEGPYPGSELHEAHTSHCIDVLIQSLMCTGSVDMITYNWVEGRNVMNADFTNNKVCKDFDSVLKWVDENGVRMNETQIRGMTPPPGAVRVPNEFAGHNVGAPSSDHHH